MKRFLRTQLERHAPGLFNGIRAVRNRRYFRRVFAQHHEEFRQRLFPDGSAITVQTGPFKGLVYFDETVWGSITPKWLGSYESELHAIVREIEAGSYETVIDVGCAEGYYAVGLAVLMPGVKVFAFDTDFISRGQVRRLAALNRVTDRVEVRTFCHHADLDALSHGKTLVVCDIEGFEAELLDPEAAPALRQDDILVEVHEASELSTEMERLLQSRFESSHEIQRVTACDRGSWIAQHGAELPGAIPAAALVKATAEDRATGRVWLWMRTKRRGGR